MFQTAWRPPDAWLAEVSAQHPDLNLDHEYVEEIGQFAGRGTWRGGYLIGHEPLDPDQISWVEQEPDEWAAASRSLSASVPQRGRPECSGEGSLNRLGLAPIADRLADWDRAERDRADDAGPVPGRIAVGATMGEEVDEEPSADGKTPSYRGSSSSRSRAGARP
jgi:Ferredoxin-like domain in Api92-like protein